MTVYDIVSLNRELLKRLHKNGIKVNDYKWLDLYNDYLQMKADGDADSAEQWWDTLSHELYHAQQAIIEYYNVPPDTEDAAWTMGYLMRKSVELVAPPCR